MYGFDTAGFANVTLDDLGTSSSIRDVQNPTSGSGIAYRPDGGSLTSSIGLNPNGTWTWFFAERSAGDQSTVTSWCLDITAVPEPVNVTLAVFGCLAVGAGGLRRWRARSGRAG